MGKLKIILLILAVSMFSNTFSQENTFFVKTNCYQIRLNKEWSDYKPIDDFIKLDFENKNILIFTKKPQRFEFKNCFKTQVRDGFIYYMPCVDIDGDNCDLEFSVYYTGYSYLLLKYKTQEIRYQILNFSKEIEILHFSE